MTSQEELMKLGLGTKEPEKTKLEAKMVSIVSVSLESTNKAKKVVFEVRHPDREETIRISSVMTIRDKKLEKVGTWLNLDSEGKIQKYSGLYTLLQKIGCPTLQDCVGRVVDTEEFDGFLVFKAY